MSTVSLGTPSEDGRCMFYGFKRAMQHAMNVHHTPCSGTPSNVWKLALITCAVIIGIGLVLSNHMHVRRSCTLRNGYG